MRAPEVGDYVAASQYHDGDPGDHFCVGVLSEIRDHYGEARYVVIDGAGVPFRANGFRRARRITRERGAWLVERFAEIERSARSVWWWVRRPISGSTTPKGVREMGQ